MNRKRLTLVFTGLLVAGLCLVSTEALAGISAVGAPQATGSWTQRFQETGVGMFDHVQVLMVRPGPFDLPVTQGNFSVGGWVELCTNTIQGSASGPFTNFMQWDISFAGASSAPLGFFFQCLNGTTVLETAYAKWTGGTWVIENYYLPAVSWNNWASCDFVNSISAVDPQQCITSPTQCLTIPFDIVRADPTNLRAYSVTFQLSPELALCGAPGGDVLEGPYLQGISPSGTSFQVVDNGGGSYTVDCAILGNPCGQTAQSGNLFNLLVKGVTEGAGSLTITSVLVRDCMNVPVACTWGPVIPVTVDWTLPTAIADLAAARNLSTGQGTGQTHAIRLTWTGGGGAVALYRAPFGNYPDYDCDGPILPPNPALAPGAPWTLVSANATSPYDDTPAARDYWYYVAIETDACGNSSAVSNMTTGTLDYLLGDVSDGFTAGLGNNRVFTEDISLLGTNYGLRGEGIVDAVGYLDVGPTTNNYIDGRPTPDDIIGFEDLVIFAINFTANVQVPQFAAAPAPADRDELTIEAPSQVVAGEEFAVSLHLMGAGDIQALSTQLGWDGAVAEPLAVQAGTLLILQDGVAFSAGPGNVDVALLGQRSQALSGDGVLATMTFRALKSGDPRVGLARVIARDPQNIGVPLLAPVRPAEVPAFTGLSPAAPNPFNRSTSLSFSLARAGTVDLSIYSVDGRRVKTLFRGTREAGSFREVWDGTDDSGSAVQPGVFFARLVAGSSQYKKAITYLR